jgi:hypothetical protein
MRTLQVDRNVSQYRLSIPTNFDLLVRTKSALIEEAWWRRKIECARRRSPRSRIAGFTSRDEYSTDSRCSTAFPLLAKGFVLPGRIVKLMDWESVSRVEQ